MALYPCWFRLSPFNPENTVAFPSRRPPWSLKSLFSFCHLTVLLGSDMKSPCCLSKEGDYSKTQGLCVLDSVNHYELHIVF